MTANWLDSYYEALEFFYWEPQHIGRKKNVDNELNTVDKVIKHLRIIETTLNHNINQFLRLAPVNFRTRLFHELFAVTLDQDFTMHGREVDAHFALENAVQPDFLFTSSTDVISIEMKVGAKSSIDQVLKYALLGLAVELQAGSPKRHRLGFLGVRDFANQWKEKFTSPNDLRNGLNNADLDAFLRKKPARARFREHQDRFICIVKEMDFGFISYRRLAEVLAAEMPPPSDTTAGAEVYRNLLSGLLSEFDRRQLTG